MNILDRVTRRDAVIGEVVIHFLASRRVPTAEELEAAHQAGGQEWDDVIHDVIRAARPLVDEDGEWTHTVLTYRGEEEVVETIDDLGLIVEAAETARALLAMRDAGLHIPARALGEVSYLYRTALDRVYADAFREALAAEQGLVD